MSSSAFSISAFREAEHSGMESESRAKGRPDYGNEIAEQKEQLASVSWGNYGGHRQYMSATGNSYGPIFE